MRDVELDGVRRKGGGRRAVQKKTPEVIAKIEELMKHDTAGDPMTGVKWTRRTTDKIACELRSLGVNVSSKTVGRLLKQLGFSLRVNHKKLCGATSEDRDTQFACIAELRERFAAAGHPIISVDTKKRELVGLFKNGGQAWNREPTLVKDHDFRSESNGIAIPYGVYDLLANRGTVFIGTSYNTPDFAVNAIEKWWRTEGRRRYPAARDLAILADAGGSNGYRCRGWKHGLQTRICNRHDIAITIAHYSVRYIQVEPSGAASVQRDQQELGGQASRQLRNHPQIHPHDHHLFRFASTRTPYPASLSRRASKSLTSGCRRFPLQRTRLYPNGTTPSDRLENGNLFCRRPLVSMFEIGPRWRKSLEFVCVIGHHGGSRRIQSRK